MKPKNCSLGFGVAVVTIACLGNGTASGQVEAPAFTPYSSDAAVAVDVAISSATPGAEIHYTLNGEEPTKLDPLIASGGSISVARSSVIKAKAWLGEQASATTTEDYRITGAISCGYQHGMALSVAGRIWSWGEQGSGRLGNGSTTGADLASPVRVVLNQGYFDNGAVIAAGYDQSIVLDKNRAVWSFGENSDGQLGNNSTSDSGTPVRVLKSATAGDFLGECIGIDAGQGFSVALQSSGVPVSWGTQSMGRLGNGSTSTSAVKYAVPVKRGDDPSYPELGGIRQVDAGYGHSMAREAHSIEQAGSTGKVWVWGRNHAGQLGQGNGDNAPRAIPMLSSANTPLTDAIDVSAGGAHSAVVRFSEGVPGLDGTVWCCGNQTSGRLGNGLTSSDNVEFPEMVLKGAGVPLTGIRQVSAGPSHTLAVDEDGHVWAWGNNQYGQLGNDSSVDSGYAVMVEDATGTGALEGIVWVSAGGESTNGRSMALAADGTIWVWGRNDEGQLGNGSTASATRLPVPHTQNHVAEGEPAVTLSVSISGLSEPFGATLTAIPSHSGPQGLGHIADLKFFVNGSLVEIKTNSPWSTALENLSPGPKRAFVLATDHDGVVAMSQSVTFDPSDFDGDGIPSSWEVEHGFDPEDSSDALEDPDQDGLNNLLENQHTTDPADEDTDDDYVLDGVEVFGI